MFCSEFFAAFRPSPAFGQPLCDAKISAPAHFGRFGTCFFTILDDFVGDFGQVFGRFCTIFAVFA